MILPGPRFLRYLAWGAPLWFLVLLFPALGLVALSWIVGLCYLAWLEWKDGPRKENFKVKRFVPARLAYRQSSEISMHLTNLSPNTQWITVREEVPDALDADQQLFEVELPPAGRAELRYTVTPQERGAFKYGRTLLRCRWGKHLVERTFTLESDTVAKVYPRFRGSSDYELLARIAERDESRRPRRLRGQGSDYDSLRPYVPGDDPRGIEWKSTARRGFLVSRVPQVERGQHLAILVDTGRLMASQVEGMPRLEYCLEAAVRLSYVVKTRGDTLSLATFSNKIETFIPKLKKHSIMPSVMESLSQVKQSSVESDYWRVTAQILSKLRQRSLVVLFTQVLDAAGSKGLISNLRRAASKHLVLCVVLSDPTLNKVVDQEVETTEEAWQLAATCDLLKRRRLALERMRAYGILVLECHPHQLSHQLIRRYLEIRRENLQ